MKALREKRISFWFATKKWVYISVKGVYMSAQGNDPDPIIAVLQVCDKLREMEEAK
ncbi:MAG: hypothetical protein KGJ90_03885 [Patescibacteria group bacterium]|nr:hypothetical protein [Patescibacteria group bacterium]